MLANGYKNIIQKILIMYNNEMDELNCMKNANESLCLLP